MILPNETHNLTRCPSSMSFFEAAVHHLDRHLHEHDEKLGQQ